MNKRKTNAASGKTVRVLRLLAALLVVALLLSLVPLYGAARYSYPGPDDYRYGLSTSRVWRETGSLFQTFAAAARVAKETYTTWQGSYAAIFLMALEPGIFSESYYGWSTALLLTTFVLAVFAAVFAAVRVLFRGADGEGAENVPAAVLLAVAAALAAVQFVPSPADAFFWFNGGVYYTFFFSLALFGAVLLITRSRKRSPVQWLLPLVAILVGGGNLVTAFLSAGLLLLYVLWQILKKRTDPLAVCTLILLLGCFVVNAFAPGNGVRQAEHASSALSPFAAVLAALSDAWTYCGAWLLGPGAFLLLAASPVAWLLAGRAQFRFRWPLLVTAFSFLLLAAGFTPTEYALGFAGEARLIDIQFDLFLLLLLLNLVWYAGWLRQRVTCKKPRMFRAVLAAVVAVSILLCGVQAVRERNSATVSAVRILASGSAASYGETWEARLVLLRDASKQEVTLPAFSAKPPLLCTLDITPRTVDAYYWYNEQLEAYYGKTLVLRELLPED